MLSVNFPRCCTEESICSRGKRKLHSVKNLILYNEPFIETHEQRFKIFEFFAKCPPDCLCANSLTDLSLVKTDCSNRNHLLIPMGLSTSTTHACVTRHK